MTRSSPEPTMTRSSPEPTMTRSSPEPTSSRLSTEPQPSKPFCEADAHPSSRILGTQSHSGPRPLLAVGELAAMARDRCALQLDGVGDVDPNIGIQRAGQQHRADLMGGTGGRKIVRERRSRRDGIEGGPAGDSVIPMVEVFLPEKDGRRIGAEDDVGPEPADDGDQLLPEPGVVLELAVGIVEELLRSPPQYAR